MRSRDCTGDSDIHHIPASLSNHGASEDGIGRVSGNGDFRSVNHTSIENPRVGSSILSLGTNQFNEIRAFCF
jgi:hypothetical protein